MVIRNDLSVETLESNMIEYVLSRKVGERVFSVTEMPLHADNV